jgi:hypothetical protein
MRANEGNIAMGLDRLNALFAWWGVPNAKEEGGIEKQMKRFQTFASDLQKTCGDAYGQQMQAFRTANDRLAQSFQELMHCRQPQDVIAAESNILATILEGASLQARTWVELTQKVQDCCAAMAREGAAEAGKQAFEVTSAKPAAGPARPATAPTGKQPAHA